jgi:hypothetical protein
VGRARVARGDVGDGGAGRVPDHALVRR